MGKYPVPMPPPGEMLRRRHAELCRHRKQKGCVGILALTAVFLMLIFSRILLIHRNQGLGMHPTVTDGDLVLAWRMGDTWSRGDLVVFHMEDQLHLGRIVAAEQDEVMMDHRGNLLINGSVCHAHSLYPTYARKPGEYPQPVPEGTVFILGDHRTQSRDSRDFGSVPLDRIAGRVFVIVRMGDL